MNNVNEGNIKQPTLNGLTPFLMSKIGVLFDNNKIEKIAESIFTKYIDEKFTLNIHHSGDVLQDKLRLIFWAVGGAMAKNPVDKLPTLK